MESLATVASENSLRFRGQALRDLDLRGANLAGADLSHANLASLDLSKANLAEAVLRKCNLRKALLREASLPKSDLRGAMLSNADLSGSNLRDADLTQARLTYSKLNGAKLTNAKLKRAKASKTEFVGAVLIDSDLEDANLMFSNLTNANLSGAEISGADLHKADLSGAILRGSDLRDCYLGGAYLAKADLTGAHFDAADLTAADLSKADLNGASLTRADLSGANLARADLTDANFSEADLSGATLVAADLIGTDLRNANLTGCRIYSIAAWNVKLGGAIQKNLLITPENQPSVEVDRLDMAQFLFLLLSNSEIRYVIDTITSKVVLILGRFTPDRKAVLDGLRSALRNRGYLPILFDFERPNNRDLTETISTLAHLARFVVADITDAKSVPQELLQIVPHLPSVPVKPLLLSSKTEYAMFEHFKRYPWVLDLLLYANLEDLLSALEQKVIIPAESLLAGIHTASPCAGRPLPLLLNSDSNFLKQSPTNFLIRLMRD